MNNNEKGEWYLDRFEEILEIRKTRKKLINDSDDPKFNEFEKKIFDKLHQCYDIYLNQFVEMTDLKDKINNTQKVNKSLKDISETEIKDWLMDLKSKDFKI